MEEMKASLVNEVSKLSDEMTDFVKV